MFDLMKKTLAENETAFKGGLENVIEVSCTFPWQLVLTQWRNLKGVVTKSRPIFRRLKARQGPPWDLTNFMRSPGEDSLMVLESSLGFTTL